MLSDFFRDFENGSEKPLFLKDNDVKFWAQFVNPEYNNDDNEFAEIRMSLYNI